MTQTQKSKPRPRQGSKFEISRFGFVSDFEIRISNFSRLLPALFLTASLACRSADTVPEDPVLSRLSPPPARAQIEGTPFRTTARRIAVLYEGGEPEEVVHLVDRLFPGNGSGPSDTRLVLATGDRAAAWAKDLDLPPEASRFATDESYLLATRLRPKERWILCAGPTPRALAYALETLHGAIRTDESGGLIVPVMTVVDGPAVPVRGIDEPDDSGWTQEDRRQLLDFALRWKFNTVMLTPPPAWYSPQPSPFFAELSELSARAGADFVDLRLRVRLKASLHADRLASLDAAARFLQEASKTNIHVVEMTIDPPSVNDDPDTAADRLRDRLSTACPGLRIYLQACGTCSAPPSDDEVGVYSPPPGFPPSPTDESFMTSGYPPHLSKLYLATAAAAFWNSSTYQPSASWIRAAGEITRLPPVPLAALRRLVAARYEVLEPQPATFSKRISSFLDHGRTEDLKACFNSVLTDVDLIGEGLSRSEPRVKKEIADWLAWNERNARGNLTALEFWDAVRYDKDAALAIELYRTFESRIGPTDAIGTGCPESLMGFWSKIQDRASDYFGLATYSGSTEQLTQIERLHELSSTPPVSYPSGSRGALHQADAKDLNADLRLLCVIQDASAPFPPETRLQVTRDGTRWEDVARLDRPVVRLTFRRRPAKGFRIWVDKPLEKEARLLKVGYRFSVPSKD